MKKLKLKIQKQPDNNLMSFKTGSITNESVSQLRFPTTQFQNQGYAKINVENCTPTISPNIPDEESAEVVKE